MITENPKHKVHFQGDKVHSQMVAKFLRVVKKVLVNRNTQIGRVGLVKPQPVCLRHALYPWQDIFANSSIYPTPCAYTRINTNFQILASAKERWKFQSWKLSAYKDAPISFESNGNYNESSASELCEKLDSNKRFQPSKIYWRTRRGIAVYINLPGAKQFL